MAVTYRQPQMVPDLRHDGQRGMTFQFPGCWSGPVPAACQNRAKTGDIDQHQDDTGPVLTSIAAVEFRPGLQPTHLLTVFDSLAKNGLDDGGRRRC
jgi:hypothetical protein